MALQALRSMFLSNKTDPYKPSSGMYKSNFSCDDTSLEMTIKNFLAKELTAGECIQRFLRHMACDDARQIRENKEIFPLVEDLLEDATWKEEWSADCGDYNPERPERWLKFLAKGDQEEIKYRDLNPKEALLLIKNNWEQIYRSLAAYEAIEYCVAASEHHSNPKYFEAAFRDFGHKMGKLYLEAKKE